MSSSSSEASHSDVSASSRLTPWPEPSSSSASTSQEGPGLAAAQAPVALPVPYGLEAAARETAGLIQTGEELLSCILYPQRMEPVLREREELARCRVRYTIEEIQ